MKTFRLDRRNGKFLGVCAGIAEYTGLDATIIRISMVVLTVASGTAWPVIGYFAAFWLASHKARKDDALTRGSTPSARTVHRMDAEMTETDRRLAEIERYVASPNSRLAREIDSLR